MDVTCTIQDNIHLYKLNIYVSRILGTHQFCRNQFCRVTPAQFIIYLKSFSKASLDINKPLHLWVFIGTLLKFRTFGSALIEIRLLLLLVLTILTHHLQSVELILQILSHDIYSIHIYLQL